MMTMELQAYDSLTEGQIADLVLLYQSEWWTQSRQEAEIRQMLKNCDVIVGISDVAAGTLVGFARVLTDYVYKALIFDVIVAPACRSHGVGRLLMDAVVNHPSLRCVKHLELHCLPELKPFYEQWGFTTDVANLHLMRLDSGCGARES